MTDEQRKIVERLARDCPTSSTYSTLVRVESATGAALLALLAESAAPRERSLFDAIAHGDEKHRAWLRQAIDDHFAGRPVQRESAAPDSAAPPHPVLQEIARAKLEPDAAQADAREPVAPCIYCGGAWVEGEMQGQRCRNCEHEKPCPKCEAPCGWCGYYAERYKGCPLCEAKAAAAPQGEAITPPTYAERAHAQELHGLIDAQIARDEAAPDAVQEDAEPGERE